MAETATGGLTGYPIGGNIITPRRTFPRRRGKTRGIIGGLRAGKMIFL